MCLPMVVDDPERLLASGEHVGFRWNVIKNSQLGIRCGYVRVPPGHPWYGTPYDDINLSVEVHRGLTYADMDEPCDKGGADNGWWVGFDCGHCGDGYDVEIMNPSAREVYEKMQSKLGLSPQETIRTTEYVEAECRSLCEQARDAALVAIS